MDEKKQVGRPKKYHNAEEMEKVIEEYFLSCMKPSFYPNGQPKLDALGNFIMEFWRPYTMSGLADALDMDRRTLLNYSHDDQFFPTIQRARRKIEMFTEEKLFEKETCNGSKFSLSNNFGWAEKQESEVKVNKLEDVL